LSQRRTSKKWSYYRRKKYHRTKRLSFWKSVPRYGFHNAWQYEKRHPRHYPLYPLWFSPTLIAMVVIAVILLFYNIEYLPMLFYLLEIVVISYLLFRLIKKLDKINIKRSILRLYGLKILSVLISVFGIYILLFTVFTFTFSMLETMLNQESIFSMIITFGYAWHTPYMIPLFLEVIGLGLCIIEADQQPH